MAPRKKNSATKPTDAEALIQKHERSLAELLGDRVLLLTDALKDLRTLRDREAALRLEVKRLMAESVARDTGREQLWHALARLRKWHKEEYQSNNDIDAQADEALTLFAPTRPGIKPN